MEEASPVRPPSEGGARVQLREGDLLTVAQAVRLLPVGRATFYRLLGDGAFPSIRVTSAGCRRGRVLVFRSGIEAYVERLLAGDTAAPQAHLDPDAILKQVRSRASCGAT